MYPITVGAQGRADALSFDADRVEIALRAIGDALLQERSDFVTSLPPLIRKDDNDWRMRLPTALAIDPDLLTKTTVTQLSSIGVSEVLVTVHPAGEDHIVYGFSLDYTSEHTLPCLGRRLPMTEYDIVFRVSPAVVGTGGKLPTYSWVALGLLLPIAWLIGRYRRPKPGTEKQTALLEVDRTRNELHVGRERIDLTEKEAQVLNLLLDRPGEVVTRQRLTEEIWTAEGVITDRSLDVYISRLRKKIRSLDHTRIVTVRGKGYTIETDQSYI